MKLQLIRNATMKLWYSDRCFLLDPYLGEAGSGPSYAGKMHSPVVPLPMTKEEILTGVDGVILSHLHSDHFDAAAQEVVPNATPLYCQPEDAPALADMGFKTVIPVDREYHMAAVSMTRMSGQHGSGEVLSDMGISSGYLFKSKGEPSLYWVGDSILTDEIRNVILHHQPDIIITHSCGAVWNEGVLIIMDDHQTIEVCLFAPKSTVIAVHMEAVDHGTVTRRQLRETAQKKGISSEQLLIPLDGEAIKVYTPL
jgi:L-ascorbate metabolism protein UlaG (beta-lactamase superfamily)